MSNYNIFKTITNYSIIFYVLIGDTETLQKEKLTTEFSRFGNTFFLDKKKSNVR